MRVTTHPILRQFFIGGGAIAFCAVMLYAGGIEFGFPKLLANGQSLQGTINEGAAGRSDWAWLTATLGTLGVIVLGIVGRMYYKLEKDRGRREDDRLKEHKQSMAELTTRFVDATTKARDDFRAMVQEERADHRSQRSEDRAMFDRHHEELIERLDSAILRAQKKAS